MNEKPQSDRTQSRHLRIDKQAICIFKFLFEAYEGIAVVETIDSKQGHIAIHVAPGCGSIVDDVLADLGGQYLIESIG